jgi:hypothetical protein
MKSQIHRIIYEQLPGERDEDGAGMVRGLGPEHHGILFQPEHRVEDEHMERVHWANNIIII